MAAVTGTGALAIGGVITLGAPSGGVYAIGMTITNASITEPETPAIVLQSQLTGTTGLAGTYQTNLSQLIVSSTFTFILWGPPSNAPNNGLAPISLSSAKPPPVLPNVYGLIPPAPLPQSVIGSTTQTSYGF
jgi:hypothetical protein